MIINNNTVTTNSKRKFYKSSTQLLLLSYSSNLIKDIQIIVFMYGKKIKDNVDIIGRQQGVRLVVTFKAF